MVLGAVYLLIVFVAFACEDYNVAVLCVFDTIADGVNSVGNDYIFAVGFVDACFDVCDNIVNALESGVIFGDNRKVRELAGNFTHFKTSCFGAIAACTEHCNEAVGFVLSEGCKHTFHRSGIVSIVN